MFRPLVLLALAVLLAGCTGAAPDADGVDAGNATDPGGADGDQGPAEVYIVAADMSYRPQSTWQFHPDDPEAPADRQIELTLKSAGGNSHPHTLVIDELDIRLETQGEFDTDTVTFTAPPGTYTFYCDVEGHRDLGMEGTLTIR